MTKVVKGDIVKGDSPLFQLFPGKRVKGDCPLLHVFSFCITAIGKHFLESDST